MMKCRKSRACSCSGSSKRIPMSQSQIQDQVDLIARHEQEFLEQRTTTERLGDSIATFVGSLTFVSIHLVSFTGWMVWNSVPGTVHFDPLPYSLLGTIVALEAIILASFILMRQTRLGRRADEREHLMLQILLLTEKEVTAGLRLNRRIAEQVGLGSVANNPEIRDLSQHTSIDDVAQVIRENLPTAE